MEIKRLFDFLTAQLRSYPLDICIAGKNEDKWKYYATRDVQSYADRLSGGLLELGVQKGDKIALVVERNRPEWLIVDIAVQQIGAVLVPVYPTISIQEYRYIFDEAEIQIVFTDAGELLDKMISVKKQLSTLSHIISLDDVQGVTSWINLLHAGHQAEVETLRDQVQKDDLATIIYTSGTTGNPKGVMLTHWNIVSNVLAAYELMPCEQGDRVMSFLPLCHIFEKVVTYAYLAGGVSITYTGLDNLGGEKGDLKAIKPHFFTAVPRLLEKVYEKIMQKGSELTGIKKKLFFWALSLTSDYEFEKTYTGIKGLQWKIADKLIFSKWRQALGGNVKGILTGAAACPENIIRTFSAAGVPVREGYGLTEAGPGISLSTYEKGGAFLGTVGPLIQCVEARIDESAGDFKDGEGEILASGDNIMQGYYKQPKLTDEVLFYENGKKWLRTGDVGTFVTGPGGKQFLKITDRKKELLKTSGGKYVAPSPIESSLKQDFLIENAMVIGEQRKFVSALIVPAVDALRMWCHENGVLWTNLEDIMNHPKVVACYQQIIDKYNKNLARFEQIKRFKLIDAPWEIVKPDGSPGELTPTLKLKRRVINERWKDIIDTMYAEV